MSPPPAFVILVCQLSVFPQVSIMAEPVLPPPPGPVPPEDPVAVEVVVPPAEPAEPVEDVEVIALVFCGFCVCSSRSLPACFGFLVA